MILKEATKRGDDVQRCHFTFPVIEQVDPQGNRVYLPLLFKLLKELKSACAQYGPTVPFTQATLELLSRRPSLLGTVNNWQGPSCQEIFYYGSQHLLSSVKALLRSAEHKRYMLYLRY